MLLLGNASLAQMYTTAAAYCCGHSNRGVEPAAACRDAKPPKRNPSDAAQHTA